jgi:hypothetical protein
LEPLRAEGFRVVHDITDTGFNIDHVVVGPPGVYAIETKFRSGSGEIEFRNGEGLFVGGREEERDSLKQARGSAYTVSQLLKEHAGVNVYVKPLVVFVGDWTIKNKWRDTDARVLTEAQLANYFANQDQPKLTRAEIALITSHLERTVRT